MKLNIRNGLLQVLNARYATFYFSDTAIIMDLFFPADIEKYSATRKYELRTQPGDRFNEDDKDMLGEGLVEGRKTDTHQKYLASRHVLELATRHAVSILSVKPSVLKIPAVKTEFLNCLQSKQS